MDTQAQKKTIKQKQASSAQTTKTKWKPSPKATDSPATGVVESTESKMEKLLKPGLKALSKPRAINDMYVLEEEPVDYEVDKPSGLTSEVVDSIKSGKLIIPEIAEFYVKKYPCIGKVISFGDKSRYKIPVGSRVLFARMGGMREQVDSNNYVFIRECDIHAVIE